MSAWRLELASGGACSKFGRSAAAAAAAAHAGIGGCGRSEALHDLRNINREDNEHRRPWEEGSDGDGGGDMVMEKVNNLRVLAGREMKMKVRERGERREKEREREGERERGREHRCIDKDSYYLLLKIAAFSQFTSINK